MLNRCEAAWDEPVSVCVLPQSCPGSPHAGLDGQWVFPVPPSGALALLGADGTETLVIGTDQEVVVPDVVAWTFRATAVAAGSRGRTARHAARPAETETASVDTAHTGGGPASGGVSGVAAVRPAGDDVLTDDVGPAREETVLARAEIDGPDDRTVTGSDLHRLLAGRNDIGPETVEDNTVLGPETEPSVSLPPLAQARAQDPLAVPRPVPSQDTSAEPFPAPPAASRGNHGPLAPVPSPSPTGAEADGAASPAHAPSSTGRPMPAPAPGHHTQAASPPPGPDAVPGPPATEPEHRPFVVRVRDTAGEAELPLDAAMVIGTQPDAGAVRYRDARTVQVQGETISRSHVCLRQWAGVVLVCDLWSTNGTRVRIPGQAPFRLRDGEEVPVIANSLVEMGDGVEVRVLGPGHGT